MSLAAVTQEAIQAKFPHIPITRIIGKPDYTTLRQLRAEIYANASAIKSPYGGGANGHLGLVMPDALYFQHTGAHYIEPNDPGPYDNLIPNNANATLQARREATHAAAKAAYDTAQATSLALKNQIINAIDNIYLSELNNPDQGFYLVTPTNLLQHLFDCFGHISKVLIEENKQTMAELFDPTAPFAHFTRCIEKCQQLATDAGAPYTDPQLVQISIAAIAKTGLFNDDYLRWTRRTLAQRTWNEFKTAFNQAYNEWRQVSKLTAGTTHMQANMVMSDELAQAFDNLALATATDKTTVEKLMQQLTQVLAEIKSLQRIIDVSCNKTNN